MKKLLVTVIFCAFCFGSYSQETFSRANLDEILDNYKKNSKSFFSEHLSNDFRAINREGKFENKDTIVSRASQSIVNTEIVDPVIFQSGDLAVVSGIHKTTRTGSDGKANTTEVGCTYTFQRRDNKWMFVAAQQTPIVKR